jgi:hypothetical protein
VWFRSSGTLAADSSLPSLSTPGGSVVDPSLLRLAADRGVTICFADLDGADGLWVPEERTVLVNRRLSEREVAAVIEHELGHVAIDDQHADLDAAVGRPPPPPSRRWAAVLTAAACLAVIGGVTAGLAGHDATLDDGPVVAPSVPPLTAQPPAPEPAVSTVVIGPDGRMLVQSGTPSAAPRATTSAATSAGRVAPPTARPSPTGSASPQPSPTTPAPTTTEPPDTGTPTVTPTTPSPEPTTASPAGDAGDGGGTDAAEDLGEATTTAGDTAGNTPGDTAGPERPGAPARTGSDVPVGRP